MNKLAFPHPCRSALAAVFCVLVPTAAGPVVRGADLTPGLPVAAVSRAEPAGVGFSEQPLFLDLSTGSGGMYRPPVTPQSPSVYTCMIAPPARRRRHCPPHLPELRRPRRCLPRHQHRPHLPPPPPPPPQAPVKVVPAPALLGTPVPQAPAKQMPMPAAQMPSMAPGPVDYVYVSVTQMVPMTQMICISMAAPRVTPEGGLANVPSTRLRSLTLTGTAVNDQGLKAVADAFNLRSLLLGRTQITDAGLASLRNLDRLRLLHLTGNRRITARDSKASRG